MGKPHTTHPCTFQWLNPASMTILSWKTSKTKHTLFAHLSAQVHDHEPMCLMYYVCVCVCVWQRASSPVEEQPSRSSGQKQVPSHLCRNTCGPSMLTPVCVSSAESTQTLSVFLLQRGSDWWRTNATTGTSLATTTLH